MIYKLAILTSHPNQYMASLFRKLAQNPEIDLTVYFCWDSGVNKAAYDSGFGKEIKWDVPMLEGYNYKLLPNFSLKPSSKFFGHFNPSITKELFNNNYDALWAHGYNSLTNWLAFFSAWINRTPIFLRGESHLLNQRPYWKKAIKSVLLKILFKNISGFLAIGAANREYYKYYKVPDKKIFNVPYVVDDGFFNKESKKWKTYNIEIRKDLGIAQGNIILLYLGKIFGGKGPGAFDLLKAYNKLKNLQTEKLKNEITLIFVGDGKEKPILENYVNKQNIKNVIFTGFKNQTEIPKYYSAADVFILPSHSEQWGLGVNESMYFNTAVIASNKVGSAYDLVHHGKNGYIFPAGNVDALSNALKNVINNRKLLQSMKIESRKIIQKWDLNACVYGTLSALKNSKI